MSLSDWAVQNFHSVHLNERLRKYYKLWLDGGWKIEEFDSLKDKVIKLLENNKIPFSRLAKETEIPPSTLRDWHKGKIKKTRTNKIPETLEQLFSDLKEITEIVRLQRENENNEIKESQLDISKTHESEPKPAENSPEPGKQIDTKKTFEELLGENEHYIAWNKLLKVEIPELKLVTRISSGTSASVYPNQFIWKPKINYTIEIEIKDLKSAPEEIVVTPKSTAGITISPPEIVLRSLNYSQRLEFCVESEHMQDFTVVHLSNLPCNILDVTVKATRAGFAESGYRGVFSSQAAMARKLFDKVKLLLDEENKQYESVDFFYLIPDINSLRKQTAKRLGDLSNIFMANKYYLHASYWESRVIKLGGTRVDESANLGNNEHWVTEKSDRRGIRIKTMLDCIKDRPTTLYIIIQDECHVDPKQGSVTSIAIKDLLALPNTLLIPISATADNQLKVLENHLNQDIAHDNSSLQLFHKHMVPWKPLPDGYFGRRDYIENQSRMIVESQLSEHVNALSRSIAITLDYVTALSEASDKDIESATINYGKIAGTNDVLNSLLDGQGGLTVIKLASVPLATNFTNVFSQLLLKRLQKSNRLEDPILVCISVSEKSKSIRCVSHPTVEIDGFADLIKTDVKGAKSATLLVVVERASMGDTFCLPFRYFDIRGRYATVGSWSSFEQVCGRAYGYGERPIVLLGEQALQVLISPDNAKKPDQVLSKLRAKPTPSKSQEDLEQISEAFPSDCMSKYRRELANCAVFNCGNSTVQCIFVALKQNGIEAEPSQIPASIKEAVEKYHFTCVIWDHDCWRATQNFSATISCLTPVGESAFNVFLFSTIEDSHIWLPKATTEYEEVYQSFQDVLYDCYELTQRDNQLDYVEEKLNQLSQLIMTKHHAGLEEEFQKTFTKRVFLVAHPQIGKTGTIISLMNKISKHWPFAPAELDSSEYPNYYEMKRESRALRNKDYLQGKYGKIYVTFEVPASYINLSHEAPSNPPLILQRIDWMISRREKVSERLPSSSIQYQLNTAKERKSAPKASVELNEIQFGAFILSIPKDVGYFADDGAILWDKVDFKVPLFVISSGRPEMATLDWEDSLQGNKCVQIVVIPAAEKQQYRDNWPNTVFALICNAESIPVGMMRNKALELAQQFKLKFIWLLDDNVSYFKRLHINPSSQNTYSDPIPLCDVLQHFESEKWANRDKYSVVCPARGSQSFSRIIRPFIAVAMRGMIMLNIEKLAKHNLRYDGSRRVAEDIHFTHLICSQQQVVCRFQKICFFKHQYNIGGSSRDTLKLFKTPQSGNLPVDMNILKFFNFALPAVASGHVLPKVAIYNQIFQQESVLECELNHRKSRFLLIDPSEVEVVTGGAAFVKSFAAGANWLAKQSQITKEFDETPTEVPLERVDSLFEATEGDLRENAIKLLTFFKKERFPVDFIAKIFSLPKLQDIRNELILCGANEENLSLGLLGVLQRKLRDEFSNENFDSQVFEHAVNENKACWFIVYPTEQKKVQFDNLLQLGFKILGKLNCTVKCEDIGYLSLCVLSKTVQTTPQTH